MIHYAVRLFTIERNAAGRVTSRAKTTLPAHSLDDACQLASKLEGGQDRVEGVERRAEPVMDVYSHGIGRVVVPLEELSSCRDAFQDACDMYRRDLESPKPFKAA